MEISLGLITVPSRVKSFAKTCSMNKCGRGSSLEGNVGLGKKS
jgi:hypothetical protein